MSDIADNIPVALAPAKNLRAVANLTTLTPEFGEPFGTNRKGDQTKSSMPVVTLRDMLDETSDRDAHFVCYVALDEDGEILPRCPRLSKDVLGQVLATGADVQMWGVAIDWDLKDHPPFRDDPSIERVEKKIPWDNLTAEQADQAIKLLGAATDRLAENGYPVNVAYATRNGARFVHVLPETVAAGSPHEALASRVRDAYRAVGLEVDNSCKDWTRLFRAPLVTLADETETWDEEWHWMEEQWDDFLVPTEADLLPSEEDVVIPRVVDVDRPDEDEVRALLENYTEDGSWVKTEAYKRAKGLLSDADCRDAIFGNAPLADDEEGWHNSVLMTVGQVIAKLHGYEWVSAEFIYALLYGPVLEMGVHSNGQPFVDQLWENVCSVWSREAAKLEARELKAEKVHAERTESPLETEDHFANGVRRWLPGAEKLTSPEIVELIRRQKLGFIFDQRKDSFHVLMRNGFYDQYPCSGNHLRTVIMERGMEWLMPTTAVVSTPKSEPKEIVLKLDTLIERFGRTFAKLELTLRHGGSHIMIDDNGVGTFRHVPFGLREDLIASRHLFPEVSGWLDSLVPDEDRANFRRALACLLAADWGPTAAVCLTGFSGTGKSMLGIGMGDCFTTGLVVPGEVLVAKHNDAMLWSPIVHVDEGIKSKGDGEDFADVFRRIVAGNQITLEPKGQPRVHCRGIHRLLMTANNLETVMSLTGHRARTAEDWDAIGERMAHFKAQERAAHFLEKLGGLDYTGFDGEGSWCGEGSDYKLARTLLWILFEEVPWANGRPERMGSRLLFEGSKKSEMLRDLESEAQGIPEVVRAINQMLTTGKHAAVEDGRIYVAQEKIIARASRDSKLEILQLRRAIYSLLLAEQREGRFTIRGSRQRWKILDLERFLQIAERIGEPPPAKAFAPAEKEPPKDRETREAEEAAEKAKDSRRLRDELG